MKCKAVRLPLEAPPFEPYTIELTVESEEEQRVLRYLALHTRALPEMLSARAKKACSGYGVEITKSCGPIVRTFLKCLGKSLVDAEIVQKVLDGPTRTCEEQPDIKPPTKPMRFYVDYMPDTRCLYGSTTHWSSKR